MRNIGTGDGTLRGAIFGTALALLVILGMNLLGSWQAARPKPDGLEGAEVLIRAMR